MVNMKDAYPGADIPDNDEWEDNRDEEEWSS